MSPVRRDAQLDCDRAAEPDEGSLQPSILISTSWANEHLRFNAASNGAAHNAVWRNSIQSPLCSSHKVTKLR